MKRFAWLFLLISLGLNLGLGYKLLRSGGQPSERSRDSGQPFHDRRAGGRDGQMGFSHRDSSQWRQIMDDRLNRVARRLELTPEQVQSFQEAHRRNQPRILAHRELVATARGRLQAVIAAGVVDPDSVRLAIHDLGRSQATLDSLITETLLQEMDTLTPEQRVRYLRILPVFRGSEGGRGSGRGGHRRPR